MSYFDKLKLEGVLIKLELIEYLIRDVAGIVMEYYGLEVIDLEMLNFWMNYRKNRTFQNLCFEDESLLLKREIFYNLNLLKYRLCSFEVKGVFALDKSINLISRKGNLLKDPMYLKNVGIMMIEQEALTILDIETHILKEMLDYQKFKGINGTIFVDGILYIRFV